MALSNAERQRRWRERRDELAKQALRNDGISRARLDEFHRLAVVLIRDLEAEGRKNIATFAPSAVALSAAYLGRLIDALCNGGDLLQAAGGGERFRKALRNEQTKAVANVAPTALRNDVGLEDIKAEIQRLMAGNPDQSDAAANKAIGSAFARARKLFLATYPKPQPMTSERETKWRRQREAAWDKWCSDWKWPGGSYRQITSAEAAAAYMKLARQMGR